MKFTTIFLGILFWGHLLWAQDSIPLKIDPVNPLKVIELSKQGNIYEVPKKEPPPVVSSNQDYYLPVFNLNPSVPLKIVKPTHFQEVKSNKKYYNRLKLGIGTYLSPHLELDYLPKRKKIALHFSHFQAIMGVKDGKNSSHLNSQFGAFGDYTKQSYNFGFELNANYRYVHFYGYDTLSKDASLDNIRQIFKELGGYFYWTKFDFGDKLNYKTQLRTWVWKDRLGTLETGFLPKVQFFYDLEIDKKLVFGINGQTSFLLDTVSIWRNTYTISTNYHQDFDLFRFQLGLRMGFDFEESIANKASNFLIFPNIQLEWDAWIKKLTLFLNIQGEIVPQNLQNLSLQNPFLRTGISPKNNYQLFQTQVGFQGKWIEKLSINTFLFYDISENFYVFINAKNNPEKFTLLFDNQKVIKTGFHFNLQFRHKKFGSDLDVNFIKYKTHSLEQAWHLPNQKLNWKLTYQTPKWQPEINLIYAGNITTFDYYSFRKIKLPHQIDAQFKMRYCFNKRLFFFGKLTNILNRSYFYFHRYRAQGRELRVGLDWKF